ncbi:cytochrome P450 [Cerioporus squamosus]|nr:cytochrome P450 [Cerioporus squamosus]
MRRLNLHSDGGDLRCKNANATEEMQPKTHLLILHFDRIRLRCNSASSTEKTQDYAARSAHATGADWRMCRKMTHEEFHAVSVKKYRPILVKQASLPVIELAEAGQEWVGRCATAGVYLVELLPILRYLPSWFPGATFQEEAKTWHQKATRQLHVPYEDFKAGQVEDCMAKALLDTFGDAEESERLAKMTTSTMYMGPSETIAVSMHTFILAMLLYPREVQEHVRREIEKVLGPHRLPTFDDFGLIPYVDALIKEVLRWHPIVPLDLLHKLRKDDVYADYHLE